MKNILISVYDKTGLDQLVPYLEQENYTIHSTGGTFNYLSSLLQAKNRLKSVSDYTQYPEICDGRVKTLHPKIFGGLLGIRENQSHVADIQSIQGIMFDAIVVNLYPFEQTLQKTSEESELLENIDIGGHTLIRAGIKNYKYVSVLTNPAQYDLYIKNEISNQQLASEAMQYVTKYDMAIHNWFTPDNEAVYYQNRSNVKYGLNPYMTPCYTYEKDNKPPYEILNGNAGYINLLDINNAIKLVLETKKLLLLDCCASFKHNSPAGVALNIRLSPIEQVYFDTKEINTPATNFMVTRDVDPKSSFGDIIGYSGRVDKSMAEQIKKCVSDGIVAYDYTPEALEILKQKKKGNYLIVKQQKIIYEKEFRDVNGVTLVQPTNDSEFIYPNTDIPIDIQNDMTLGYTTLKYTQSNSVCFVLEGRVIGIGAGQQNRVDCVKIAGEKAKQWMKKHGRNTGNLVLISDAFFPFADNIDVANEYGVKYILQPGGSIRDEEIHEACKKYDITMVLSGKRIFTH